MVSEKIIKELSGFSGCKIFLIQKQDGNYFVRKISKSPDYNVRMIEQKKKQQFFSEHLQKDKISAPKILGDGYIDGLFYFDMEYIQGISFVKRIENANLEELKKISEDLVSILKIVSENKNGNKISFHELVLNKLNEILKKENTLQNRSALENTIEVVTKDRIASKDGDIVSTFCHGDLTLENIIYDDNNGMCYLIDFLDSFLDHYWQDISKLFQDLEGHWYSFRNKEINKTAMEIKTSIIIDCMLKNLLINDKYLEKHHMLLATTFCRILPYAKDEEKEWIRQRIESSLKSKLKIVL